MSDTKFFSPLSDFGGMVFGQGVPEYQAVSVNQDLSGDCM